MKSKKSLKIVIILMCIVIVVSSVFIGIGVFNNKSNEEYSNDNYISLDYGFTDIKITDEKSALEAIDSVKDVIGIDDVNNELKIERIDKIDNTTYYRFQQYYEGIPVYGKNVCISSDNDGNAYALTTNYIQIEYNENISNLISYDEINKSVKKHLSNENISIKNTSEDNLIYFADSKSKMRLAYKMIVYGTDNLYEIIADAKNSDILSIIKILDKESANVYSKRNNNISAIGWKNDDNTFLLYNEEYNISIFDFNDANKNLHDKDGNENYILDFHEYGADVVCSKTDRFYESGVLLLKNLISANDYYKNLGFDGFYRTHACLHDDRLYKNAAGGSARNEQGQDCAVVFIGTEEEPVLDLIGHEFTHAVTRSIVSWNGESPGINEGFSDIFGELFEYYISGESDWVHGPRIIKNPSDNNYPQNVNDENNSGEDSEHGYSTVISHAAYLMWNGIDGNECMKIDCDKLAQLWYRTLFILQSDSTFKQFANAITITATHMVRNGDLTPLQLQCVIKALSETGIQHNDDLPAVEQGADLFVKDMNLNPYNNYHLTVTEIKTIDLKLGKTVIDTDVSSTEGYKLDLKPGKYEISVKDNLQNGSSNTFSRLIMIVAPTFRDQYRALGKSVTIFTDFGKDLIMLDFLGMEFEELTDLYGDNYDVCESAGWIPSSPSSERRIGYSKQKMPFDFIVWTGRETPLDPYGNDEVTDVMYTKTLSNDVYSIDGNIQTDITWKELQKITDGNKFLYDQYYAYSYKIEDPLGDISVIFEYESMPNDNSVADYIILTEYFEVEEDNWSANILYQPIIEKYRAECEQNHPNDYIYCCTWFLFDVDNNGVDELIIREQDGGAEQAKYHHYFSVNNGEVIDLGGYSAWHMGLYEDDGELYGKVVSPNGPTEYYKMVLSDNKIKTKLVKSIDKSSDDGGYPPYTNPITSVDTMDISYDIYEWQ